MHSIYASSILNLVVTFWAGLLGEGAVQVLYSTDEYKQDPILAAVGQLQFEVRRRLNLCMMVLLVLGAHETIRLPCHRWSSIA